MIKIRHGLQVTLQPGNIRVMFYEWNRQVYVLHNVFSCRGSSPRIRPSGYRYGYLLSFHAFYENRSWQYQCMSETRGLFKATSVLPNNVLCPKETL